MVSYHDIYIYILLEYINWREYGIPVVVIACTFGRLVVEADEAKSVAKEGPNNLIGTYILPPLASVWDPVL